MAQAAEELQDHPFLAGAAIRESADGAPHLYGTECADCGTKFFPPAPVCPECMSESVGEIELGPDGTLYSWSVVHVAPKNWKVPYVAGYVDLPGNVRVFAHIVGADPASLTMDMPVTLTTAELFEEAGVPVESYAFTPKKD